MDKMVDFQEMIAPRLIEALFVLISAGCIFLGVLMAFQDRPNSLLFGAILAIGGPLITRIWCEFLIVIFRIYETLRDVNDQLLEVLEVVEEEDAGVHV